MLKNFLLLITYAITCFNVSAQSNEMAVEVIQPQTLCVNSITSLNGSTRRIIAVKLPENTIRWYYSFSANRNKADLDQVRANFNLFSKLSYLIDQTGTTATAISIMGKPPGTHYCDVFLLSSGNEVKSFEEKLRFSYNRQGSRENFVSGVVDINDSNFNNGWQYIGLRNNDFNDAVNILIQVVAIVKIETKTNGWTAKQKQQLYDKFKTNISQNSNSQLSKEQIEDICFCLMNKIIEAYKPEDLSGYAEYELNNIMKKIGSKCLEELEIK